MLIYLTGKIVAVVPDQIIVKLPNGVGYLIDVRPRSRYIVNENVDLYIVQNGESMIALDTLDERLWVDKLIKIGVDTLVAIDLIRSLGAKKLNQALADRDNQALQDLIPIKLITKLFKTYGSSDSKERLNDKPESSGSYTAVDFTQNMIKLEFPRSQIVRVISQLKKEGLWDRVSLATLVKRSVEILEGPRI